MNDPQAIFNLVFILAVFALPLLIGVFLFSHFMKWMRKKGSELKTVEQHGIRTTATVTEIYFEGVDNEQRWAKYTYNDDQGGTHEGKLPTLNYKENETLDVYYISEKPEKVYTADVIERLRNSPGYQATRRPQDQPSRSPARLD